MNAADLQKPNLNPVSEKQTFPKKVLQIGVIVALCLIASNFLMYSFGKRQGYNQKTKEVNNSVDFVANNNLQKPSPTQPQEMDNAGTPSPTIQPRITTRIFTSDPALDGTVTSSGIVENGISIEVGRNVNTVKRGFVSFDLSSLPGGITVQTATLKMYQSNTVGTPYTTNGEVRIDHLTYGNSLDPDDYSIAALVVNLTSLSISGRVGIKEVDVTQAVRDDVANARGSSQFRIHASKELTGGDIAGDVAFFQASDTGNPVNKPQLVIDYY